MKGQASSEYVIIVGLALLLTIPTVVLFFSQSAGNIEQVNGAQARQVVRRVVDNAESVYYLGMPSATTIRVNMPSGIESIQVLNRGILVRIKDSSGYNDYFEPSSVNLTGNLTPHSGAFFIRLANIGGAVNVTYDEAT